MSFGYVIPHQVIFLIIYGSHEKVEISWVKHPIYRSVSQQELNCDQSTLYNFLKGQMMSFKVDILHKSQTTNI